MGGQPLFWICYWTMFSNKLCHITYVSILPCKIYAGSGIIRIAECSQCNAGKVNEYRCDGIFLLCITLGYMLPKCINEFSVMTKWHTHITVTIIWALWRLKSPASRLFTQSFIQAQIKECIKAPRHWPLWGEFTGDRWITRTKGQWRGKCFHLITSSCTLNEAKLKIEYWRSHRKCFWTTVFKSLIREELIICIYQHSSKFSRTYVA